MGKRHVKQETILKEAKRIWMHLQKNLQEGEGLMDLTWRPVGTKVGPPGWSYILTMDVKVGDPPEPQGFAFGPEPPTVKNIEESVVVVREKLESGIIRKKIIVPPKGKIIT